MPAAPMNDPHIHAYHLQKQFGRTSRRLGGSSLDSLHSTKLRRLHSVLGYGDPLSMQHTSDFDIAFNYVAHMWLSDHVEFVKADSHMECYTTYN